MKTIAMKYRTKEMTAASSEMAYASSNDSGVSDSGYHSTNVSPGSANRQTPSPVDSGLESDNSPGSKGNRQIDDVLAEFENLKSSTSAAQEGGAVVGADGKPTHSYIALISMAILSVPERKMLLCDIYQYIMDTFEYYNNEEKPWRNSIRHNLSLNECFIKAGRSDNGKGNYWTIHPACMDDFARGDFRRRQARRRAKKCTKTVSGSHMERSAYNINIGYVPMTSSHIGYHPYSNAASMQHAYYKQQSTAFSPVSQAQSSMTARTSPLTSQSNPMTDTEQSVYWPEYSYMSNPAMSAAAQRFLADHTGATAFTMQAYAQQAALASSLHYQHM